MAPQPTPEPAPADASRLQVVDAIDSLHESIRQLGSPAKALAAGESYLTVPIGQALPKPPDVAAEGKVPGGVLTPCTLATLAPGQVVVNRNEILLQFPFPQGFRLELTRIHVNLPVFLEEQELEKQEEETTNVSVFVTEAEAKKASEFEGGKVTETVTTVPIGFETRFSQTVANISYSFNANTLKTKTKSKVSRSVLPITPQVVVRLKGPDGELWSGGFSTPLHFVEGTAGKALGTGVIDEYADLQNSITANNQRVYSLALFVLVPTTVASNPQLGEELKSKAAVAGNGAITIFYTVDPAHVGK